MLKTYVNNWALSLGIFLTNTSLRYFKKVCNVVSPFVNNGISSVSVHTSIPTNAIKIFNEVYSWKNEMKLVNKFYECRYW